MQKDIHPSYHHDIKVTCACGNTFVTGSTVKEIRVEICSNCHPFYTGKQKLVDTARRVDRFNRLKEKSEEEVRSRMKQSSAKRSQPKARTPKAASAKKKSISPKERTAAAAKNA